MVNLLAAWEKVTNRPSESLQTKSVLMCPNDASGQVTFMFLVTSRKNGHAPGALTGWLRCAESRAESRMRLLHEIQVRSTGN